MADKWNESLFTSGLRVENGENFDDIIYRADKALDFLTNQDGKDLLVITHGFFLKTMIVRVLLGLSLTEENFKNFQSAVNMKNTGLSVLQYGRWQEEKPLWRLWIYNDHSHLG